MFDEECDFEKSRKKLTLEQFWVEIWIFTKLRTTTRPRNWIPGFYQYLQVFVRLVVAWFRVDLGVLSELRGILILVDSMFVDFSVFSWFSGDFVYRVSIFRDLALKFSIERRRTGSGCSVQKEGFLSRVVHWTGKGVALFRSGRCKGYRKYRRERVLNFESNFRIGAHFEGFGSTRRNFHLRFLSQYDVLLLSTEQVEFYLSVV